MSQISPLAYIHPDAQLGAGVVVEPFAAIYQDVVIGAESHIASHVVIHPGARIGQKCRIFPGAIISSIPQDLKFNNENTIVRIGDHVTIREYATINRGTTYSHETVIEDHVLIMSYVHVAHDCVIERRAILANCVNLAGHVTIGEHAVIGGMSAIHQFIRIGKHVMLSGGSLVGKDVPPYVLAARHPLTYTGVNSVGLRRRGFDNEQINEIKEIYRYLYQKGYNYRHALEAIEQELADTPLRQDIVAFVRASERGIMRRYHSAKAAKDDD